jgi:hypothetical protein
MGAGMIEHPERPKVEIHNDELNAMIACQMDTIKALLASYVTMGVSVDVGEAIRQRANAVKARAERLNELIALVRERMHQYADRFDAHLAQLAQVQQETHAAQQEAQGATKQ